MLGAALEPLTAAARSVPQLHTLFLWPTSTNGRAVQRCCVSFPLVSRGGNSVRHAAFLPCLLCYPFHGTCPAHTLHVCMCRVLQCRKTCSCHGRPLEEQCVHRRIMMEFMADAGAARTMSTGGCWQKGVRNVCHADEVQTILRHHT